MSRINLATLSGISADDTKAIGAGTGIPISISGDAASGIALNMGSPGYGWTTSGRVATGLLAMDPTGTNDSAAALQAAVTWLNSNGGGIIEIPSGTFKMASGLIVPVNGPSITIRGSGNQNTTLSWATDLGANVFAIRGPHPPNGYAHFQIESLWMRGPGGTFALGAGYPQNGGVTVQMDGLNVGNSGVARDLRISGFLNGLVILDDHERFDNLLIQSCYAGVCFSSRFYYSYTGDGGDQLFVDCSFGTNAWADFYVEGARQIPNSPTGATMATASLTLSGSAQTLQVNAGYTINSLGDFPASGYLLLQQSTVNGNKPVVVSYTGYTAGTQTFSGVTCQGNTSTFTAGATVQAANETSPSGITFLRNHGTSPYWFYKEGPAAVRSCGSLLFLYLANEGFANALFSANGGAGMQSFSYGEIRIVEYAGDSPNSNTKIAAQPANWWIDCSAKVIIEGSGMWTGALANGYFAQLAVGSDLGEDIGSAISQCGTTKAVAGQGNSTCRWKAQTLNYWNAEGFIGNIQGVAPSDGDLIEEFMNGNGPPLLYVRRFTGALTSRAIAVCNTWQTTSNYATLTTRGGKYINVAANNTVAEGAGLIPDRTNLGKVIQWAPGVEQHLFYPSNESLAGASGTFTLSAIGQTSSPAYNVTAAALQTALQTIFGAGNVFCTGGPLNTAPIIIQFAGTLSGVAQDIIKITASPTGLTYGPACIAAAPQIVGVCEKATSGTTAQQIPCQLSLG